MSTQLQLLLLATSVLLLTALGCHRLECETNADCPHHLTCVGSSVCPDDVVCVWEGEPGICLPTDEAAICEHTGGAWDEGSCGHYECGNAPDCEAIIPGCDCGPDAVFVEFRGCVDDIACTGGCYSDEDCDEDLVCHGARLHPEHPTHPKLGQLPECMWGHDRPGECVPPEVALCEESGGSWDEESCGDYPCGEFPMCDAIIPGCDCGPMANYVEGEGCVKDSECPGVCASDEDCLDDQICRKHPWPVEMMSMAPEMWCETDDCEPLLGMCVDPDVDLCRWTGGTWDEMRCGHSTCQSDVTCLAIIPGCTCGPTASWKDGKGCVEDLACEPIKCSPEAPCPDGMACLPCPDGIACLPPLSPMPAEATDATVSAYRPEYEFGICRRVPTPLPM